MLNALIENYDLVNRELREQLNYIKWYIGKLKV